MTKHAGWSLIETLIVVAVILIIAAIAIPLLTHDKTVYTITTPHGTYQDTRCYPVGGGVQCDKAFYGGDTIVTPSMRGSR